MKKFLSMIVLLMVSCSTAVIPLTKDVHEPYKGEVIVFQSESQIKGNYEVVSAIHHYDWGKYQRLTIEDVIPVLKEKAQACGANAVIIDNCLLRYIQQEGGCQG